ncbi:Fic family protein [Candidatus Parcubacteria bacterium]|nr:Fic family protein [Candidatus Parcubacteria bacterium]
MFFKLKKPLTKKIDLKSDLNEMMDVLRKDDFNKEPLNFDEKSSNPEYLYWDKFQYKELIPKNIKKEKLWVMVKILRDIRSKKTPILDDKNNIFRWIKLSKFEEFFHNIDMNTGGKLFSSKKDIDKNNKQKLISNGIMEEAIASSQLEGAATTRKVAKKFLRENRKPKNESEQMILNNYLTMQSIENEYKNRSMNMDLLLELHKMITKDTLTDEGKIPCLRAGGISVIDPINGKIYHEAPNISFVKKELKRLVLFANDELESDNFIHPVVKAIMLHFWIGYLHPFTDGNGRLARLFFYWYLLKNNYWAFAYLPISKIIKKSPKQYTMSYVYSEQDDNDLTYFIDYNIRKIRLAVKEFEEYLEKEQKSNLQMNKKARLKYNFNERQIQLLQYLYRAPEERTSLRMHMNIYQVSAKSAIKDLKGLEKQKFLISKKQGRNIYYYPDDKINKLFL